MSYLPAGGGRVEKKGGAIQDMEHNASLSDEKDLRVEDALLQKAVGYTWTGTTREYKVVQGEDGEEERVLTKEKSVTRHVSGDLSAQMYWLSHRQGGAWQGEDQPGASGVVILPAAEAEPLPQEEGADDDGD